MIRKIINQKVITFLAVTYVAMMAGVVWNRMQIDQAKRDIGSIKPRIERIEKTVVVQSRQIRVIRTNARQSYGYGSGNRPAVRRHQQPRHQVVKHNNHPPKPGVTVIKHPISQQQQDKQDPIVPVAPEPTKTDCLICIPQLIPNQPELDIPKLI